MYTIKNKIDFLCITLFILMFTNCASQKTQTVRGKKTYPYYFQECKTITVNKLEQLDKFNASCYNIKAYISHKKVCPPCPKGVLCKPCAPSAIFLTDTFQKKFHNFRDIHLKLNVKINETEQFKKGDYGIFTFLSYLNVKATEDKKLTKYTYRLLGYNLHKE